MMRICLLLIVVSGCASSRDESLDLIFEDRHSIGNFDIAGRPARIHTQGLFVTENHYFVTGRLETEPRRSVFLRISRADTKQIEYVDITPIDALPNGAGRGLDHPGGFDFDGKAFWIPVSGSQPDSKTVVLRFGHDPDAPLAEATNEVAFHVDDHIGALAYDRWTNRLYGANWDTKIIYVFTPDGGVAERIPRESLVAGDPGWALAIQDFKCAGPNRVLAGGKDNRSDRDPSRSRAVVELLDIRARRSVARRHLHSPPGIDCFVTREGLAWREDRVFFLPGDLGDKAYVLQYHAKHGFSHP